MRKERLTLTQPVINIFYIKINSISNNGAFSIGETLHHSHRVNSKSTGTNASFGDRAGATAQMKNTYIDPDVNDQGELSPPSDK
ncbi:spore germination protein [Paenibacillus thalictri]|uniref:Spore germination protein n=1 Tax=Paenibacillus thalictri TaxID=2527873 RepID=A0A4Q9DLS2_9BACL|nr:spore germination protein [Paenibacillus thalictri]TBL74695.1 spore germination protein [Paenibacillus thalictri]